jgi:Ca-activated chloride channel family protein
MRVTPRLGLIVVIVVAVAAVGYYVSTQTSNDIGARRDVMSYEDAVGELSDQLVNISWSKGIVSGVTTVAEQATSLADTLPPITTFPLVVDVPSGGDVTAEIFVSSEKSGTGTDGWMAEAARAFNTQNQKLKSGRGAKIEIRKIASGTGYQFIGSRKHLPDGYSPSNHLWVQMAAAQGVAMTPIRERTVRNIAGIVMKSRVAEELKASFGDVTVPNIVNAVVQRKIATGYTNPYASSTGLNFLVTVLATFAEGDEAKLLSPAVVSAFEGFQIGVPFVALTTLQMRDSVRQDGSLDAFVMEYQTYVKTDELKSGYEFVPFGVLHDNPLYAVGQPGPDKLEVLELFAEFLEQDKYQRLAEDYGFNPTIQHDPPFELPGGATLIRAQKVWKEKKDAGRPIAAVLKALTGGSGFILPTNAIGLVQFSHEVTVLLPIKPFELLHKSAFLTAVKQLETSGQTAMYDGIAVALNLLIEEKRKRPEVKPMLFVLTDGQSGSGLTFDEMSPVIRGLRIPVYTIGFEADLEELSRLSSLVEAASLKAGEGDLRYKIGALLNSQM